uniref:Uncharacterized protein n=1 Tax=Parascaris equorum TaxID=6256 RepID=A0A914RTB0_PAREQ
MGSYGPARLLGIYGGIVGLIYIETDGLRHDTPLLYALPPLALAAFTYGLTMNRATKVLTSISFIAIGMLSLTLPTLHHPTFSLID